jgi:CRP/FNR family transcriptional regulator, cyclic AMP receptor protein
VLAGAREAVVPKGACVVRAGDRADHWVGLMDGIVVQMVVSGDGEATVLTAAGAGAWFGEGTLMKRGRWGYDAIARKEAKVALVPASTFRWLIGGQPAVQRCSPGCDERKACHPSRHS